MRLALLLRALSVSPLILLSSCGSWFDFMNSTVAAVPLENIDQIEENAPAFVTTMQPNDQKMYYLSKLIDNSESSCNAFIARLTVGENTSDAFLDVTSVTAGALGAVFTPMGTIHILSATSAIASGSRTSLNTDLYGKATAANFAQAIQITYYTALNGVINDLGNDYANNINININNYENRINGIHAECSLGSAEASISSALQIPGSENTTAPAAKTTTTMTISGPVADGDTFAVTDLETPVQAQGDTPATVAVKLVAAINKSEALKGDGVSAAVDPSNNSSIIIFGPAGSGLSIKPIWTSKTAIITVSASTTNANFVPGTFPNK